MPMRTENHKRIQSDHRHLSRTPNWKNEAKTSKHQRTDPKKASYKQTRKKKDLKPEFREI